MMAVTIRKNGANLEIGSPKALFDSKIMSGINASFDVSKDGRFLIPVQDEAASPAMTLVVNWQAGKK